MDSDSRHGCSDSRKTIEALPQALHNIKWAHCHHQPLFSSGIVRTLPIVGVHKALIWTLRISHLYHKSIHHTTCKRKHNRSAMQKYKGNIINCIFMKHLLNSSSKPYIHLKIQEIWWCLILVPFLGLLTLIWWAIHSSTTVLVYYQLLNIPAPSLVWGIFIKKFIPGLLLVLGLL
jgi:hypothetical protein